MVEIKKLIRRVVLELPHGQTVDLQLADDGKSWAVMVVDIGTPVGMGWTPEEAAQALFDVMERRGAEARTTIKEFVRVAKDWLPDIEKPREEKVSRRKSKTWCDDCHCDPCRCEQRA